MARYPSATDLPPDMLPTAPQHFEPGRIWLIEYPIRYFGIRCNARTTLIRTEDGQLIVHSPCPLTDEVRRFAEGLAPVSVILAPGTYHHLYAAAWAEAYGQATLFACRGLERKVPALKDATIIEDGRQYSWSSELEHLTTQGCLIVNEVAFLHKATKTLILTDLLEYFTDDTPGNLAVRIWLKYIFRMWNRPAFAPEYRFGWSNRKKARRVLEQILAWDFRRIIIGHGELIHEDAKAVAARAWSPILK